MSLTHTTLPESNLPESTLPDSTLEPTELIPVLEIGGTHVTAALVDTHSSTVVESHRVHLDSAGSRIAILDCLADIARRLGGGHRRWAVAIPGPFDYEQGIGRYARVDKFDSLADVDLRTALTARLDSRPEIVFVNDADAFGIGEVLAGAGRGHRRAICLTLGTGIGSAFIADGEPVNDGPTVPPDGSVHLLQYDGADIEETVSRRAIRRRFTDLTGEESDVHEIAELARSGDAAALQVFTVCFTALGACLAPWVARFEATALVLGGSIAGSFDLIDRPFHDGLRHGDPAVAVTAYPATHVTTAALVGAAHHAQTLVRSLPKVS